MDCPDLYRIEAWRDRRQANSRRDRSLPPSRSRATVPPMPTSGPGSSINVWVASPGRLTILATPLRTPRQACVELNACWYRLDRRRRSSVGGCDGVVGREPWRPPRAPCRHRPAAGWEQISRFADCNQSARACVPADSQQPERNIGRERLGGPYRGRDKRSQSSSSSIVSIKRTRARTPSIASHHLSKSIIGGGPRRRRGIGRHCVVCDPALQR